MGNSPRYAPKPRGKPSLKNGDYFNSKGGLSLELDGWNIHILVYSDLQYLHPDHGPSGTRWGNHPKSPKTSPSQGNIPTYSHTHSRGQFSIANLPTGCFRRIGGKLWIPLQRQVERAKLSQDLVPPCPICAPTIFWFHKLRIYFLNTILRNHTGCCANAIKSRISNRKTTSHLNITV